MEIVVVVVPILHMGEEIIVCVREEEEATATITHLFKHLFQKAEVVALVPEEPPEKPLIMKVVVLALEHVLCPLDTNIVIMVAELVQAVDNTNKIRYNIYTFDHRDERCKVMLVFVS